MSLPTCFDHTNSIWWRDVNNKSDHHPPSQALIYVTAADIPVKRTNGNCARKIQFSKSSYRFPCISRCLLCVRARAFALQFNSISFPSISPTTVTNVGIRFLTLKSKQRKLLLFQQYYTISNCKRLWKLTSLSFSHTHTHTNSLFRSLTHKNQHPSASTLKATMLPNANSRSGTVHRLRPQNTTVWTCASGARHRQISAGRGDAKDNTSCVNAGTPLSSVLMTHKRKHTASAHDNSNCRHTEKSLFLQISNLLWVCVCVCVSLSNNYE